VSFVLHRVVGSRTVLRSVDERDLRIGRGAGCELRLEDTAVSLEHALVRKERGNYHLTDLGSVTGTYVNGEPVATALLRDGDEVGVGGFLIRVRRSDPEDPLFLHIRPADAEPRPGAAALPVESVDYGRRYRLRRRFWTKGLIAVLLTLAGVAVMAAIPAARRTEAFRPGDLTSFHTDRPGTASCSACHTPWRGVADASCQECHGEGRIAPAPLHHPEAMAEAAPLACTACHREHMGRERLMPATDAPCRSCHGGLEVASGVEPLFAADVPSLGEHPEIRLTLPAESGAGARGSGFRRVPLSDPAARRSDPTAVAFGHALHLARPLPRSGAAAEPDGERAGGLEQLACDSCHRPAGGDFAPISFEQHCSRCHALTFDGRYPERQAEHGAPEVVARDLGLFYQEAGRPTGAPFRPRDELAGFLGPGGRSREQRARVAREEALHAERRLYQTACSTCHALELAGGLRPESVEDPAIPERWLSHARFDHADHLDLPAGSQRLACAACHAGVESSDETADVLLPSIASCISCHAPDALRGHRRAGETVSAAGASVPVIPGPSSCRTCHDYHSGNRFPGIAVAAQAPGGAP
jgi:hypothetical protein